MANKITLTNTTTGVNTVLPDHPLGYDLDSSQIGEIKISPNNRYVGWAYSARAGDNNVAVVYDTTNQTYLDIPSPLIAPTDSWFCELRFDMTSRFGCFTDQSHMVIIFELANGNLINVNIPDEYRSYIWVSSVFSPNQPKLYLAGYDIRNEEYRLGKSVILEIENSGWTVLRALQVPFLTRTHPDVAPGLHSKLAINNDGTLLYIPNLHSTNVIYDINSGEFTTTGFKNDEFLAFGKLDKYVALMNNSNTAGVYSYPKFEKVRDLEYISGIWDVSLQPTGYSVGNFPWTGTPQPFINSFKGSVPTLVTNPFRDPVTKEVILDRPFSSWNTDERTALGYYVDACAALGLNSSETIPDVLGDDLAVMRDTNVSPFQAKWTGPAPYLKFSISPDGGIGFYLREPTIVPSYVAPFNGSDKLHLTRSTFCTANPPILTLCSKAKNQDMQLIEYREQKNSEYTLGYMRLQEVYGNYPQILEIAFLFGSDGRIDYVTSPDPVGVRNERFLIADETKPGKNVLYLFGTYDELPNNYYANIFTNMGHLYPYPPEP